MVTPRRTRLHRADTLHTFQSAIARLILAEAPWTVRDTVVLVPTDGAAAQLRRTLEMRLQAAGARESAVVLPEMLTRDGWYRRMAERSDRAAVVVSDIERYVHMLAAARQAVAEGCDPPFEVRPGLIPSIIEFYDQLLRQRQSIDSFERLAVADLEPSADLDRGARRLLRQTRFLVAAYRAFYARLDESDRMDEHRLRSFLLESEQRDSFSRAIVTVADHAAEPDGLWPADYDLLTRLPGLEQVDLVATDAVLDSGFYERLIERLPGIDEQPPARNSVEPPELVAPEATGRAHFVRRDREQELAAVLEAIKSGASAVDGREAVVFQRPLPYVYLAPPLFKRARVPLHVRSALPLAAEPYAAVVDLVSEFVISNHSRAATVALLRSPHLGFTYRGEPLDDRSIEALDHALSKLRFVGGTERLASLAESWAALRPGVRGREALLAQAAPAVQVAAAVAGQLSPLSEAGPPSKMIDLLQSFLRAHGSDGDRDPRLRSSRARRAVSASLAALARAHRLIDDTPMELRALMLSIRRWLESQTFPPGLDEDGVQLLDARAARYGQFRELFIVGLVDDEWPERTPRSIFYPVSILSTLGWSHDRERRRAALARFLDLVSLASERVRVSTFLLEDDVLVTPSVFLERLEATSLPRTQETESRRCWVTADEALARGSSPPPDLPGSEAVWLALRLGRQTGDAKLSGVVGRSRATTFSVSALERYAECPFKYFARHELGLREEPADELTLTARRRGVLLHQLLERFYASWQDSPGGPITPPTLDLARRRFRTIVDQTLGDLPRSDCPSLHAWLLGSVAAPGVVDQLCALEMSNPVDVVERLVELPIEGTFVLRGRDGPYRARIKGVADRIDLLGDGTFRVIDYKTERAPNRKLALQLPTYARCAEQQLDGYRGRRWHAGEAAYMAFGEPRVLVPLTQRRFDDAMAAAEARAVSVLTDIGAGVFPPRPAELHRCSSCPFSTVCRKDYVDTHAYPD